jgi:NAD(P)-dependent dehydrogenase (short-subunit alcohol dehydrogenase family)
MEDEARNSTAFAGKVALVSGASQGIGEGVARLLARRGAAGIVITGRNEERGEAVAASISEAAPTVFVRAELTDLDDCHRAVETTLERFDRIDVLVNSGGSTHRGGLDDTTPEIWDMLFDVNVRAPFFMIKWVVEAMRARSIEGSIVNIISQVSHVSWPDLVPYGASKGAMVNLTRTLAAVLAHDRIRINGLNIGWTNTPGEHEVRRRFYGDTDGSWLEAAGASQPFGRLLEIEEVARAVAFLASSESGIMTGSVVDYDQTVFGMSANPAT